MKKYMVSVILIVTICLAGCHNYQISAEPGSKWSSTEPIINLEIIQGNQASGTMIINDTTVGIECIIGPGKAEFCIFPAQSEDQEYIDGDGWLFRGDYHYNSRSEIIKLSIIRDQIGLNVNEITLYKQ